MIKFNKVNVSSRKLATKNFPKDNHDGMPFEVSVRKVKISSIVILRGKAHYGYSG